MREVVNHKLLECETSTQLKFKLDSCVIDAMLNECCDGQIYFLSVMDLISTFEDTIVDHDYII